MEGADAHHQLSPCLGEVSLYRHFAQAERGQLRGVVHNIFQPLHFVFACSIFLVLWCEGGVV